MVLATRISAPNTSLAVIRPKPRPDSPTASEISVIMLKSELPHETPNPLSKKTTGIYSSSHRRGDCLPPRGDRANCAKNLPARHARARAADQREEPARRVPAEGAGTTRLRAWQKSVI